MQRYEFHGSLVSGTCGLTAAPGYGPLNVGFARLRIDQTGPAAAISGSLWIPQLSGQNDTADVEGAATYPLWETMGSAGDLVVWAQLNGLPRERNGCREVGGALEVRRAAPECVVRWEGIWSWFDN